MNMKDKYQTELTKLIQDFDELIQVELKNSFLQSVDDLGLEESTYDIIVNILGTPNEFLTAYIEEIEDLQTHSIRKKDKKLSNSYKWMVLFQITAFVLPFMGAITFDGIILPILLGYTILSYLVMIIVVALMYAYFSSERLLRKDIANLYYTAYKILIIFLIANLITDDYVLSSSIKVYDSSTYRHGYYDIGTFIFWQLPIAIVSGIELSVIKSKRQLVTPEFKINQGRLLYELKKIVYIMSFIVLYGSRDLYILLGISILVTMILVVQMLDRRRNGIMLKKSFVEVMIVNSLFVVQWLLSTLYFGDWN